jgi:hypothetical protein
VKRVLALAAVVVAIGAGVTWDSAYQPLELNGMAIEVGSQPTLVRTSGLMAGETVASAEFTQQQPDPLAEDDRVTARIDHWQGRQIVFVVRLENTGRVGVTVSDLDFAWSNASPVRDVRVINDDSFSLGGGAARDVIVRGVTRIVDCESYAPGASVIVDDLTIDFRVFGLPHSAKLRMPLRVEVRLPDDWVCPAIID